jgi:hypothetical protein
VGHDYLLAAFSKTLLSLSPDSSFNVTLLVHGQVMAGTVRTRDRWLQSLSEVPSRSADSALIFAQVVEGIEAAWQGAELEGGSSDYEFLHLTDVRLFGGPSDDWRQLHWRVRLTDVSGWSFGAPG